MQIARPLSDAYLEAALEAMRDEIPQYEHFDNPPCALDYVELAEWSISKLPIKEHALLNLFMKNRDLRRYIEEAFFYVGSVYETFTNEEEWSMSNAPNDPSVHFTVNFRRMIHENDEWDRKIYR